MNINSLKNLYNLKLLTSPEIEYEKQKNQIILTPTKDPNYCLRNKISFIKDFFYSVGEDLQKLYPISLKNICKKVLQYTQQDPEIHQTIKNIFDNNTIPTKIKRNFQFVYIIAEPPTNFAEFQRNIELILEKYPRYELGNDLEVYDASYRALPSNWDQKSIYQKLLSEFCKYDNELMAGNLVEVKEKIKKLYKPIIPVQLGICLDGSGKGANGVDDDVVFMWCKDFIENNMPFIVNKFIFQTWGKDLIKETSLSQWEIYSQEKGIWCVALPSAIKPESLGFNTESLLKWNRPLSSLCCLPSEFTEFLQQCFKNENDEGIFARFINLFGHGTSGEPQNFKLNKEGVMVCMTVNNFQNLLRGLAVCNTKALSIISCYIGGTNSLQIHDDGTLPFPIYIGGSFETTNQFLKTTYIKFLKKSSELMFPKEFFGKGPSQLNKKQWDELAEILDGYNFMNTSSYFLASNKADIPKVAYLSQKKTLIDLDRELKVLKSKNPYQEEFIIPDKGSMTTFYSFSSPVVPATIEKAKDKNIIFISRGGRSHHFLKKLNTYDSSFVDIFAYLFTSKIKTKKAYYIKEVEFYFNGTHSALENVLINYNQREIIYKVQGHKNYMKSVFAKNFSHHTLSNITSTEAHAEIYKTAVKTTPSWSHLYQTTGGKQDGFYFFNVLKEEFWGDDLPLDVKLYAAIIKKEVYYKKIESDYEAICKNLTSTNSLTEAIEELKICQNFTEEEKKIIFRNGIDLATEIPNENVRVEVRHETSPSLVKALKKGTVEAVKEVLLNDAHSLNQVDMNGNTALILAVSNNQVDIAKYLLEQEGIDINIKNRFSTQAFEFVYLDSLIGIAEIFLQRGVELQENQYIDLIESAIINKQVKMVNFFIEKKLVSHPKAPLLSLTAQSEKRVDFFKQLIPHFDVNQMYKDETALSRSILSEDEVAIAYLLKNNADPNIKNKKGNTPLHIAIKSKNENAISIIKLLLHYNSDINSHNELGNTPLSEAIIHKNMEAIKFLIEQGAALNINNKANKTSLDLSAESQEVLNMVSKLPKLNLNLPDEKGLSALGKALLSNCLPLAKRLVEVGADIRQCTLNEALFKEYFKTNFTNPLKNSHELVCLLLTLFESEFEINVEESIIEPITFKHIGFQIDFDILKFILAEKDKALAQDSKMALKNIEIDPLKIFEAFLEVTNKERKSIIWRTALKVAIPLLLKKGVAPKRIQQIIQMMPFATNRVIN